MSADRQIVVVGGGLAGGLLSIMLRRRGYEVRVYERRSDSRKGVEYGGRSINLALSHRGLRALHRVGLAEAALERAIPMRGRQIHRASGGSEFQPYSPNAGEYINSISRAGLNELLLDQAEEEGVDIRFEHDCVAVDFEHRSVIVEDSRAGSRATVRDVVVFGTDGAGSVVRRSMEEQGLTMASSEFLDHGYKELTIPAAGDGTHRLESVECLHIWPRRAFMLIALPNLNGSFTCTLFLALNGPVSFDALKTNRDIAAFFQSEFPDATAHMPNLISDFRDNPVSTLGTVRCYPWTVEGFTLLLGDAAHAIVPFYGQGMNCAFEDCLVLDDLLESGGSDWTTVFKSFESARKPDADAIAQLALANFVEMRDKVADPRFALRKQLEIELARRFPNEYTPIYSHVTFSNIPYSEALRFAETQAAALDTFLNGVSSIDDVNWDEAASLVKELI